MNKSCPMCFAISKEGRQQIENTVLYETERFVVIPTLGQFIEGWLMVVAKNHTRCAGALDLKSLDELSYVIQTSQEAISEVCSQSIVFEHGPLTAGCCVEHTHLHIVPCRSPERFRSLISIECSAKCHLTELPQINRIDNRKGYLLVSSGRKDLYNIYTVDTIVPRQYLRQMLSVTEHCQDYWDWRLYPFYNNIYRTVNALRPF